MSTPPTVVRPPWPDELPRLADAFPGLAFTRPLHLRVLAVPATAGSPERLVGVAALAAPAEGKPDATLAFVVRPRFVATEHTRELLAAILAAAREERFSSIVTHAPADATPRIDLLRAAGFSPTTESGLWRLELGAGN